MWHLLTIVTRSLSLTKSNIISKNILRPCLLLPVVTGLFSCDCGFSAKGVIADAETGVGLDSVRINCLHVYTKKGGSKRLEDSLYTDEQGYYDYQQITGLDKIGKCPTLELELLKKGYVTTVVNDLANTSDADTIFLQKQ